MKQLGWIVLESLGDDPQVFKYYPTDQNNIFDRKASAEEHARQSHQYYPNNPAPVVVAAFYDEEETERLISIAAVVRSKGIRS